MLDSTKVNGAGFTVSEIQAGKKKIAAYVSVQTALLALSFTRIGVVAETSKGEADIE